MSSSKQMRLRIHSSGLQQYWSWRQNGHWAAKWWSITVWYSGIWCSV